MRTAAHEPAPLGRALRGASKQSSERAGLCRAVHSTPPGDRPGSVAQDRSPPARWRADAPGWDGHAPPDEGRHKGPDWLRSPGHAADGALRRAVGSHAQEPRRGPLAVAVGPPGRASFQRGSQRALAARFRARVSALPPLPSGTARSGAGDLTESTLPHVLLGARLQCFARTRRPRPARPVAGRPLSRARLWPSPVGVPRRGRRNGEPVRSVRAWQPGRDRASGTSRPKTTADNA